MGSINVVGGYNVPITQNYYVSFDATNYIDLGIQHDAQSEFETRLRIDNPTDEGFNAVFGASDGGNTNGIAYIAGVIGVGDKGHYFINDGASSGKVGTVPVDFMKVEFFANTGDGYVDDLLIYNGSPFVGSCSNNMHMGCYNRAGSFDDLGPKTYDYFQFKHNNTIYLLNFTEGSGNTVYDQFGTAYTIVGNPVTWTPTSYPVQPDPVQPPEVIVQIANDTEFQAYTTAYTGTEMTVLELAPNDYNLSNSNVKSWLTYRGEPGVNLNIAAEVDVINLNNIQFEYVDINCTATMVRMFEMTDCDEITFQYCNVNWNNNCQLGFHMTNVDNLTFLQCVMSGTTDSKGIELIGCTDVSVAFNNISDTGRAAISVRRDNINVTVDNNTVSNNVNNYTVIDGAIDVYGPDNLNTRITNNNVSNYGSAGTDAIGIRIKGSDDTYCAGNTVRSNDYAFAHLYVQQRDGIVDDGVILENNTLIHEGSLTLGYSIRVTECYDLNIINNNIDSNSAAITSLIELRNFVDGTLIENNTVEAGVTYTNGVYEYPGSTITNVTIQNNF